MSTRLATTALTDSEERHLRARLTRVRNAGASTLTTSRRTNDDVERDALPPSRPCPPGTKLAGTRNQTDIGRARTASPNEAGIVRKATRRSDWRRRLAHSRVVVRRRAPRQPPRWRSLPTATPNSPSGSCISRKAYCSHAPPGLLAGEDAVDEDVDLRRGDPAVAGPIRVAIPAHRRVLESGVQLGREAPALAAQRGELHHGLRRPPSSVPIAQP